jgi:hypothetical protein
MRKDPLACAQLEDKRTRHDYPSPGAEIEKDVGTWLVIVGAAATETSVTTAKAVMTPTIVSAK